MPELIAEDVPEHGLAALSEALPHAPGGSWDTRAEEREWISMALEFRQNTLKTAIGCRMSLPAFGRKTRSMSGSVTLIARAIIPYRCAYATDDIDRGRPGIEWKGGVQ